MNEIKRLKKIMECEKELENPKLTDNEKTNIKIKIIKLEKRNMDSNGIYIALIIVWIPFLLMLIFHLGKLK